MMRVGPILPDDYSPILQATFEPFEGVSLSRYLDRIDPVYLRKTARSLLGLLHSITEASNAFDRSLAKDALGLRRAAMLERVDRNIHAGMILVWALVQQRSREKFHDLDAMAQMFLTAAMSVAQCFDESVSRLRSHCSQGLLRFAHARDDLAAATRRRPKSRGVSIPGPAPRRRWTRSEQFRSASR